MQIYKPPRVAHNRNTLRTRKAYYAPYAILKDAAKVQNYPDMTKKRIFPAESFAVYYIFYIFVAF